jgi:hypothetical protein
MQTAGRKTIEPTAEERSTRMPNRKREIQSGAALGGLRGRSLLLIIIALPILIGGLAIALDVAELYLNSSPDRSAAEAASVASRACGSSAAFFGASAPMSLR